MANSPVTPADALANVPDSTASLCSGFVKALLRGPTLFYQFLNWLLDSDGNLNPVILGTGTYMFSAVPMTETGRLLCDGRPVSRTTYATLFAAIGTVYGSGDGTTTFNLPDFQDRFPMGASGTRSVGTEGGEETHVLTAAEGAAENHSHVVGRMYSDGELSGDTGDDVALLTGDLVAEGPGRMVAGKGDHNQPVTVLESPPLGYPIGEWINTAPSGGATDVEGHNNMPPFLAVYVYIVT